MHSNLFIVYWKQHGLHTRPATTTRRVSVDLRHVLLLCQTIFWSHLVLIQLVVLVSATVNLWLVSVVTSTQCIVSVVVRTGSRGGDGCTTSVFESSQQVPWEQSTQCLLYCKVHNAPNLAKTTKSLEWRDVTYDMGGCARSITYMAQDHGERDNELLCEMLGNETEVS